jgi:hypothetical protein
MSNGNLDNIDERLAQLEQGFVELRTQHSSRLERLEYLVGELSDVARLHQQGLRLMQSDMQTMQADIRGLQVTANRILERLEQHLSDGHGS